MAILLFKLAQVPDDEAEEIRELLANNEIFFYETHAGFWRLGVDALWLVDSEQEAHARALIQVYQAERLARQQKVYAELVEQGKAPTLWQNFCASPLRFVLLMVGILLILSMSFAPLTFLGK